MVETIKAAASPALDHIIERPRLIARLGEGGGARVSVLAAPAGYGKTTLARQWSERQDGPVAWYRTTRASGDVALLAVQLDDLLASIAPELPREPEKVATIASVNPSPQPLGRAILRTFEMLSRDVLLVVDEWEAAATDEAEELLSMLVEGLDIRFLITTRTRPEWFTPRLEVYGEGLEIGVDELTMTDGEAALVLNTVGAVAGRARLMRTAEGWPAVLGLAAMSGDVDFTSSRLLSHTLYDFLASELLASAAEKTQDALMLLAVAHITDVDLAHSVLDADADAVLADAMERGLISVTEHRSLSLHPLLRELLVNRFGEVDAKARAALLVRCHRLFDERRWDEALCVAEASKDAAFATEAIGAALDDLLPAGRTSSLQRWVSAARAAGAEGGLIDYAESEALLRGNELNRAVAVAGQATASLDGDLLARAHLVAARSALLTDRSESAERHASAAASLARTSETEEDALWLRFLAACEPQACDLTARLDDFKRKARPGVTQALLSATGDLALAETEGALDGAMDKASVALCLAEGVDTIARTSLLNAYSYALILKCRYQESLDRVTELMRVAEACGVDFPVPYAQLNSASAYIGIRRFAAADRVLTTLEREAGDNPNEFFRGNVPIHRARLYASVGDIHRAIEVLALGPATKGSRALHGDFLGWQALLYSASGAFELASELADSAQKVSRGLEAAALAWIARAVAAVRTAGQSAEANSYIAAAIATGVWDPILIAVRAVPDLGRQIATHREGSDWLRRILVLSSDTSLAALIGLRVPRPAKPKQKLTPRETEVHELLAQGLTNEEIAKLLYISLSTAKVHVKHIYEKLGVRSRLEAARALRHDV
jgi:LuxR family maltose regulon positive regulatory protein